MKTLTYTLEQMGLRPRLWPFLWNPAGCKLSEAQLEKQAQQHETEITRLVKQHDRAFSVIEKLKK